MMYKKNDESEKKPVFLLLLLSLLFYGIMLFLTFAAPAIHKARLPQVTIGRLSKQQFVYTVTENGVSYEITKNITGIPKELVDSGQIFTVTSDVRNGYTYYYVERIAVDIDRTKLNSDYYAIASDYFMTSQIILSGYESLEDGDEVTLTKTNVD